MRAWVWNPHVGGKTIPPAVQERTERRIRAHAESQYAGSFTRLSIRFRGALCYIDAFIAPTPPSRLLLRRSGETREQYVRRVSSIPMHLCRLRYLGDEEGWSLAFYAYSSERYEPCTFEDGQFLGSPERGFDIGAMYLPQPKGRKRGRRTRG